MVSSSPTPTQPAATKFRFSIDRGGTFTDVYAEVPPKSAADPGFRVHKLLSEDPSYEDAPREAIRRILEQETGVPHPRDQPVDSSKIEYIRMGTTVATNALLERKGERIAFVTTKGFHDILYIGNQSRPKIFDLKIQRPDILYERVVQIDERVRVISEQGTATTKEQRNAEINVLKQIARRDFRNASKQQEEVKRDETKADVSDDVEVVEGLTKEQVVVLKHPDESEVRRQLQEVYDAGIKSLAVCLVHSYTYSDHEKLVGRIAKDIGFTHVSLSSELMAMIKLVPRGHNACADGYLTPVIQQYLHRFSKGFDSEFTKRVQVAFMQSDGGLTTMEQFSGHRAVLSGPAGGVVGYARTTKLPAKALSKKTMKNQLTDDKHRSEQNQADGTAPSSSNDTIRHEVIGFDMGGTSTDVSRYDGRQYEHVFENTVAGVTLMTPQLDINTVAAGGGSQLFFRNGMFVVGPESAGANPGPACYKRGGPLTITDANLMLKRLLPEKFPSIFGKNRDEPLDVEVTKQKFEELTQQINQHFEQSGDKQPKMSPEDVALGFLTVANETMCRPIRALTQAKGYDIQTHILACFGGAGGQHAAAIARALGMRDIYVHSMAGILSAYGLSVSDIVVEQQEPASTEFVEQQEASINKRIEQLQQEAVEKLVKQGFTVKDIRTTAFLNLRYKGTDTAVMTSLPHLVEQQPEKSPSTHNQHTVKEYLQQFTSNYKREYGFTLDRPVLVDDVRIRAVAKSTNTSSTSRAGIADDVANKPLHERYSTYFDGKWFDDTKIYELKHLRADFQVEGPAIIIDQTSTILVEPKSTATITLDGSVHIRIDSGKDEEQMQADDPVDSIQLSVFAHRFMSIAEQMGRTIQRTAISTNIKERLDFSCALFDGEGGLVANAPHLPVHLGAMQEAVKWQIQHRRQRAQKDGSAAKWRHGDVFISNHPRAGGSHLPDITVITPVLDNNETESDKPLFYVASRGHHSDIGGISPGSMPPFSKTLWDEGAAIRSFKLVDDGKFDEEGVTKLLKAEEIPNMDDVDEADRPRQKLIGTRNLSDCLSDLRAQVAANTKGIHLLHELIDQYGKGVVLAYMQHIQDAAELAVRNMLKDIAKKHGLKQPVDTLHAVDYMDDGTPVCLALTINSEKGEAKFDFAGTGPEMHANLNAPPAVTYSAIIYVLRCLVDLDIPLNQGCLEPITIDIPRGSFLNASEYAAVVGGNVLTSQRVTDVVLKAFQACAASQGCMNNLTFGDQTFGYYETIAGGAGAGKGWHGTSGVQVHMTNTRATDIEIMERRYPVLMREFSLRPNSGGAGQWKGGDGVIRDIQWLKEVDIGILSERRTYHPYGLAGGEDGACGINLIVTKNGRTLTLGPRNTYAAQPGDRFRVLTPGGGGYGIVGGTDDGHEVHTELKHPAAMYSAVGSVANWNAAQLGA